jgi:hypothetical protein
MVSCLSVGGVLDGGSEAAAGDEVDSTKACERSEHSRRSLAERFIVVFV